MNTGRKISIAIVFVVAGLVLAESIKLKREEKYLQDAGKAEPINSAIHAGDLNRIQMLIAEDRTILNATGVKASTPLNEAAALGRMDIVQLLITNGASVNAADDFELTPLHCAARTGNKEITELFLSKGADVNAKAHGGVTALHMAVKSKNKDVVQLLISKGADIHAKSMTPEYAGPTLEDRYTPLQWAKHIGAPEIADILRKAGAKE